MTIRFNHQLLDTVQSPAIVKLLRAFGAKTEAEIEAEKAAAAEAKSKADAEESEKRWAEIEAEEQRKEKALQSKVDSCLSGKA